MIQCHEQDGILTIQFNRPDKKNAFTSAMYLQLRDALIAGDLDPAVKVILICGSGKIFSAEIGRAHV